MQETPNHKIFISAAEVSGDKHSARLIRQVRSDMPWITWDGLGGYAMAANNCNLLENLVDRSAMLTHVIGQLGFYRKLLARVKEHLVTNRPDLVILVDSPAWNFHIAKAAYQLQIPVLYYIAPQLWAWGQWRIKKLRRWVNHVACILPFEQQWFRDRNVSADYVGHPLFDDDLPIQAEEPRSSESRNFPTVALLAGSRGHEIESLWQPMQQIARQILLEYPDARFITAAYNDDYADKLSKQADPALAIDIRQRNIEATARHADLALVASGTATLEVAAQQCPMIVMYHVNRFYWYLARRFLLKTRYISLVNILAQKELVPEFIPFASKISAITAKALELLGDDKKCRKNQQELQDLLKPIVQPGASEKVAEIIKEMMPRY